MKIMIIGNSHSQDTFWLLHEAFADQMTSTLSVTTSFLAVYLTCRRSPWFALAYAANDIILIVLWSLASMEDRSYFSVVICFVLFFMNDIYGYISWKNMQRRQSRCDMV